MFLPHPLLPASSSLFSFPPPSRSSGIGVDAKNLDAIQAKLQMAQEEKQKHTGQEVTTLQQEENVSISGSNARLMIMKKLSRKSEGSKM